jgi:mannose-6-phosphate isomerase
MRKGRTVNQPLRFVPFLRPMVWGGRRLRALLGKPLPSDGLYGESWEISDHLLHRSVVAGGTRGGQTLRDLMESDRRALLGPATGHETFPLLVKFLDACDWLSVQVHPDEEQVRRLWPGEGSKTETWFVLDAAPGSRIYAGLQPGVDERELRAALAAGAAAECLHQFEPRAGDCLFLPAGTVHAVGGGVLLAEVQQTSDATFRLFDWNRRDAQGKARALHIEEGLASINWRQGPVQPVRVPGFTLDAAPKQPVERHRQSLVRCCYFELEFVRDTRAFSCGEPGRLHLLLVVGGGGTLTSDGEEVPLSIGQVWLLPAALPAAQARPQGSLAVLVVTLPDF